MEQNEIVEIAQKGSGRKRLAVGKTDNDYQTEEIYRFRPAHVESICKQQYGGPGYIHPYR